MTSSIPFWSNDPTILMNKEYIKELYPMPNMTYEQKLNAITRLVILLIVIGFIFTASLKLLFMGIITVVVIFILFKTQKQKVTKESFLNGISGSDGISASKGNGTSKSTSRGIKGKEGFSNISASNGTTIINPETLQEFLKTDFEPNTKLNPFANVLLTDIGDNPERKSAPPSFNPDVYEDITSSTKKMVQKLNPGIKNTNKQLFGDLGEKFYLDQSNRNFFSTANTRIANDQTAYANFLYGNMPSSKESGIDGAMQRVKDNPRYNLY
jgi:hypothetical protein